MIHINCRRHSAAAVLAAVLVIAITSFGHAQSTTRGAKAKPVADDSSSTRTKMAAGKAQPQHAHKVVVYYFHGGVRCTNCINFEKYTDELMRTTFAEAVKNGSVEWRVVNTDERGNEHFMQDYQLYTKSLVVVDTRDGKPTRYKNLTGIWQTIGDKNRFQTYVRGEIAGFTGDK